MLELHGFLTSKERQALKHVLHRRGHSAQEHGRANAILLIDDGVPIPLIAKLLFLDEQSIRNFLQRYRGKSSVQAPEEMAKLTKQIRDKVSAGLQNQHQRDAFAQTMDALDRQTQVAAMTYRDGQLEDARRETLESQIEGIRRKGAAEWRNALTPDGRIVNRGRIEQIIYDTHQRYYGAPDELIALEAQKNVEKFHESIINAMERPEDVLAYMEDDRVKEELGPEKVAKFKKAQGKLMIDAAKKDSENQMRQIGIELGEMYDTEIEIERALYDIKDKALADIARTEALRIQKARLLSGEKGRKDDQARANREEATRIAGAAKTEAEAQSMVDALEDVSEADREDIQKQAFARVKINAAATEAEKKEAEERLKELEDESARVNAEAIGRTARDETDILDTVSAMEGVTQSYRDKVHKMAMAQLKVKQSRQAREKADVTNQAMKVMEQNGWSLAAISPEWSKEVQDQMRDLAEQRQIIAADPFRLEKALEYCAMPREQLLAKINAGEWPRMTIELGGEKSAEFKKVWARVFDEGNTRAHLQTPVQHAQTRYNATGVSKSYAPQFMLRFERELQQRAFEKGIDDIQKVPREDQDDILDRLLHERDISAPENMSYLLRDILSRLPVTSRFVGKPKAPANYEFMDDRVIPEAVKPHLNKGDLYVGDLLASENYVIERDGGGFAVVDPEGNVIKTQEGGTIQMLMNDLGDVMSDWSTPWYDRKWQ